MIRQEQRSAQLSFDFRPRPRAANDDDWLSPAPPLHMRMSAGAPAADPQRHDQDVQPKPSRASQKERG
ncbi:MAG TPA: hypothetical protein VGN97_12265 [Mesorhizobium sp.]|jgi:hypothetical protein|nr:hypothetical protein [Mesorhizobium sp.]